MKNSVNSGKHTVFQKKIIQLNCTHQGIWFDIHPYFKSKLKKVIFKKDLEKWNKNLIPLLWSGCPRFDPLVAILVHTS